MSDLSLRVEEVSVTTGVNALIELSRELYHNDSNYVPPLQAWLRYRLSKKNSFWKEADFNFYVAKKGTRILGTISALYDRQHEKYQHEKVAFFGFFESVDNLEVAKALLAKVHAQANSWNASFVRGPRNISRVEETGILVDGFSTKPPMFAGHHPRFYQEFFKQLGYRKHHDVLAYDTLFHDFLGNPLPLPEKLREKAESVNIPGLVVRPVALRSIYRDLEIAYEVFVEAFRDVPENTPMPKKQFMSLASILLLFSNKNLLQLATVSGKAAGFALCFPEVNEAILASRGKLLPLGWLRLLKNLSRIQTASFKLIGVLPQYRASGLHAKLIKSAILGMRQGNYQRLEASLVDERNTKTRRVIEDFGLTTYRRYRVYEKASALT